MMFMKEHKNLSCLIVETYANAPEMMFLQSSNYAFNDEFACIWNIPSSGSVKVSSIY